jgi:arylsulfate sulfotransferase
MENIKEKRNIAIGIASVILIIGLFAFLFISRPDSAATGASEDNIFQNAIDLIRQQERIEAELLAELNSGHYCFDFPLVVVDPYNASPLTAMILFTTDEPMSISIHIEGKTALADVNFNFDGPNTLHIIPVLGLYADTINTVIITGIGGGQSI